MKKRTMIVSLLLVVSLLTPTIALADQTASDDWGAVQALSPGERVKINLKDGQNGNGKIVSVTDTSVTIDDDGKNQTFQRDRIFQVYQSKRKAEKGKYAAIGAVIGGGAGLGIGLAKNSPPVDDGRIYPIGGLIVGAGIGAAGGFIFGQAKRKSTLIYQAR